MTANTDEQQTLTEHDARLLEECVSGGGVAVFPTDTVYGVCCDPGDERAARRLYALKGRPAARPAAVMFFAIEPALEALGELDHDERAALTVLLPGPVTVLLSNPVALRARVQDRSGDARSARPEAARAPARARRER